MGQSTDAILAYGYDLGDPDASEDFPFEPFDEDKHTKKSNPVGWLFYSGEALDGVVGIRHCSDRCPMYIIAAAGSEIRAWRGSPRVINALVAKPEWDANLERFMRVHSIKTSNPPAWLLASDWS